MWSEVLGKGRNLEIAYEELSQRVAPVGQAFLSGLLFKDVSQY